MAERSLQPERMDLEPLDHASAVSILGTLEKVNAWLGGVRATLHHVQEFSRRWKPGETIRFIDWGTGGADLPRALVRWGRANGFRLEVVGGLHHLGDAEIVNLLRRSDMLARRGIIMNDLKRSARAWLWIWLLTRLSGAHPIVKNDAPLSVRRAFQPRELDYLARQAGLTYLKANTHFGYRLTLAGEKAPHPPSSTVPPLPVGEGLTNRSPLPPGEGSGVRRG